VITSSDGNIELRVDNVQSFGGYVLHIGAMEHGKVVVVVEKVVLVVAISLQ